MLGLCLWISIYTDGQKKHFSKILSCVACSSQTRAAQAYHDQNLESSLGVILICWLCLPDMWSNIHVYILIVVNIIFLLSNLPNFYVGSSTILPYMSDLFGSINLLWAFVGQLCQKYISSIINPWQNKKNNHLEIQPCCSKDNHSVTVVNDT